LFSKVSQASSFSTFVQLCIEQTGRECDPNVFTKIQEEREVLDEQSNQLALMLEAEGIPAFDHEADVSIVGLSSGQEQHLQAFRQITFLPSVARKKRAERLRMLNYYVDQPENRLSTRMWVFNLGRRVPLVKVRSRIQQLSRMVSSFATELRQKYNIDIIFRSTELGKIIKNGEVNPKSGNRIMLEGVPEGDPTFHIHAHCLVKTPYLKDWGSVIRWVNKRWREINNMDPAEKWQPFDESGKIVKVREVCKYVAKPSDLLQLGQTEVGDLFHQVKGLHLVQFSGSLQNQRRSLKDQGQRPVRRKKGANMGWDIVPTWNKLSDSVYEAIAQTKKAKVKPTPKDNRVMAFLQPSFFFNVVAEPAVLVSRYNGDLSSLVQEHPKVCLVYDMCEGLREHSAGTANAPGTPAPYTLDSWSKTVGGAREGKTKAGVDPPEMHEIPF
jgi:hypothetical protein